MAGYFQGNPHLGMPVTPYHPSMQQAPVVSFAYPFAMPQQYPYALQAHPQANYGSHPAMTNTPHTGQPAAARYARAEALSQRPPLRGQYAQQMLTPSQQLHHPRDQPQQAHVGLPTSAPYPPAQKIRYHPGSMSSSSFDSAGDNLNGRTSGRATAEENPPPPPPPPSGPPPPLNAAHFRRDSAGSVSSLGSMDRSTSRDYNPEREVDSRPRHGGIFQRLNPWGVAASSQEQVPNPDSSGIDDYHRRVDPLHLHSTSRTLPYRDPTGATQLAMLTGLTQSRTSSRSSR